MIAYSHCIAHGIDMSTAMTHQRDAVASEVLAAGRYEPAAVGRGKHPFHLDSKRPSIPVSVFASKEARFAMLARSDPMRAEDLARLARVTSTRGGACTNRWRRSTAATVGRMPTAAPSRRSPAETETRRWTRREPRPEHHLPRDDPAEPDRAVRVTPRPAHRHPQSAPDAAWPRWSSVAVRGADRARRDPDDRALESGAESFAEALTYLPTFADYTTGTDAYLRHRGHRRGARDPRDRQPQRHLARGWVEHARRIEEAGAAALELNVYFIAADPDETGAAVEQRTVELVQAVRARCTIPLAVKIGPFFSSVGMARRLTEAGADGLVLQPLHAARHRPRHPSRRPHAAAVDPRGGAASAAVDRDPPRTPRLLARRDTGVHMAADVLKPLLAGADVTMMASALLRRGPGYVGTVLAEIEAWLVERGYAGVGQLKGSMSQANIPNPVAFARANYAQLVTSFVSPFDWRMAEPEGELRA